MAAVIDLTGQKFGRLTAIRLHGRTKFGESLWYCECDCGGTKIARSSKLRCGDVSSCGCYWNESRQRHIDLTDQRIGDLTVLKFAYSKNGQRYWECKCDCGNTVFINTSKLNCHRIKSCGCAISRATVARSTKHGYSKRNSHRLYNIHRKMILRCEDATNNVYKHYGGRGIKVCDEWHDLKVFGDWAMANGYDENLTIERIDVNGNYCPENCKWATIKEQANNKRNTVKVVIEGKELTLNEVSEQYNIRRNLLHKRYYHGIRGEKLIANKDLRFRKEDNNGKC